MNLPNWLSVSRVLAVFIIAGLLGLSGAIAAWAALTVYILAALTDALDGWVARRFNQITTVGKFLDALVDKIFVLGVLIVLLGPLSPLRLPGSSLAAVLMLTREFAVTGLRILAVQQGVVLAAERGGKIKTALQMSALGALLLANALQHEPSGGAYYPETLAIGQTLLWLAVLQTLRSGWGYFSKYAYLLREPSDRDPSSKQST